MARRRTSFVDDLISLPWYVGAVFGAIAWFAAPLVANFVVSTSPLLSQARESIISIARLFAYVCIGAAAISLIRGFYLKHKFGTQRSLADLRSLSWQMFESIVGEAFRRQGYTVIETGQGGADGGVDLVLMKDGNRYLVQCKQYRASSVSVMVVREIFGVVAAQRAAGAIVVTTGAFTKDAIEFARSQPIELIDGAKLEQMVRGINGVTTSAPASIEAVASPPSRAKARAPAGTNKPDNCPKCGSEMVLRTAREKGTQFYGCSRFPKCRGVRPV